MNKPRKALLFINDFTDGGREKFFTYSEGKVSECSAEAVAADTSELICHDYWLIVPAVYRKAKCLPKHITDVEELRISTSGRRKDREARDRNDVSNALSAFLDVETIGRYRNIVFKNASFDVEVFGKVGEALLRLFDEVEENAKNVNEWERYQQIERPVSDYLIRTAALGIAVDTDALRKHKVRIDFLYYMALKEFSAKYSLPLQVPSDEDVVEYLAPRGFDFSGVSVEYVLDFVPMNDGFAGDLLKLRDVSFSRMLLKAIPLSQKRIYPLVDTFGSITSRIYYKDPSLQNLSKIHRDIIAPDEGMKLSYVDFGQYEAGIMGSLSNDAAMLALFTSGDLYLKAAEQIFADATKRKDAKRLFLSYAYGMKRKSLVDAAVKLGAEREAAKTFFNQFAGFETWKASVHEEFHSNGRIGTAFGNYLARDGSDELSEKEKRSAVSQVVQGTASLIFKKALIKLSDMGDVVLKVPMHDAVLFQHPPDFDPSVVAELFAGVFTEHFNGSIKGKASVERFFLN